MEKYSDEHILYLRELKRKNIAINLIRISLLVAIIILWQIAADMKWINSVITSSPKEIILTIHSLISDKTLFRHIGYTLFETLTGFSLATLFGIILGSALWAFPVASRVMDPYLVVLNALPKVALGPLIIVWAGAGMEAIIIMTLSISLISTVISVYSGLRSVNEETILLMRSFGANQLQMLKYALLPASCQSIIGALKINVSLSWVGVIMGEFLVSKAGIGYLIMYGSQVFNLDLVMAGIIILCILAGGMYLMVSLFEGWTKKKGWTV
ncbi:MAG: ABC transporter permease [Eubacteriaceae bacterium]|nr:ABC transporter permease [Eubacteriaceae bacterium]